MSIPENLKYTQDHEWAKVEGQQATVGITEHAQSSLGDIVFVELPEVGRELSAGETFGVVESVKAVSDLMAPVAGTVTEVNQTLIDDPSTVNRAPYEGGWIVKITMKDAAAAKNLMDPAAYRELLSSL